MLLHEDEVEDEDEESVKITFTCISYLVRYFHPMFLHVLHLDVLRRRTDIETESEN